MCRSPSCWSCSKHVDGLNRGAWIANEDKILSEYIKTHGVGRWGNLPKKAGLRRCGKSCRLRWLNYLRPDIKRGNISPEEDELLVRLHRLLGNRWSLIAGRLPSRTGNEIKNYWNTQLSKRVKMGEFEPRFQRPFKRWGIPSAPDYDEDGVVDKDSYTSQTLPLKRRAVRYCGRALVNGDILDSYDYDHVPDNHDGINQEEDLKAADDRVGEIDTSKSWSQLLFEDCMGDYQNDLLEAINGLQPNASNGTDHRHQSPSPSFSQSIILQENHSSCNLIDQEFPHSKHFNSSCFDSFSDLGELSIIVP